MEKTAGLEIGITEIMRLLPHRYPFLMVDAAKIIIPEQEIIGYKNVTFNEPFFQGHFPSHPIMPGVMIAEAMAQTGALLDIDDEKQSDTLLLGIDEAKFRRPVVPGDQLEMRVVKLKKKLNVFKFRGEARVGGQIAAEAVFTAMLVPRNR